MRPAVSLISSTRKSARRSNVNRRTDNSSVLRDEFALPKSRAISFYVSCCESPPFPNPNWSRSDRAPSFLLDLSCGDAAASCVRGRVGFLLRARATMLMQRIRLCPCGGRARTRRGARRPARRGGSRRQFVPPLWVAAIGAYSPLSTLANAAALSKSLLAGANSGRVGQQIGEPNAQMQCANRCRT